MPAPQPDAAGLPFIIPSGQRADFYWVISRMSVLNATYSSAASSY
jgi:hypothetical protein